MAIIGNIFKIQKQLKDKNLDIVFEYFKEALDKNSSIHKRIFDSPVDSFDKVYISDEIFALEQVFYTKDREECFIESHRDYIDFQLLLYGKEQMEYVDIDKLKVTISYDETKDLIVYKSTDGTSRFLLEENDLAIFFPDDAHIGLAKYVKSELIYKTVVKLPVKLFI